MLECQQTLEITPNTDHEGWVDTERRLLLLGRQRKEGRERFSQKLYDEQDKKKEQVKSRDSSSDVFLSLLEN